MKHIPTVVSILGARPQFVRAAAVSPALRSAGLREVLVHTGQHYDWAMSAAFFEGWGLPAPDVNLRIGSASHGAQTGRMLEAIEQVLCDARPAMVIVFGDTNSTLVGALAAAKLLIPVAHIEAVLRSFDRATALIWRVLGVAEWTIRRLNAPELLPAAYAGVTYRDGAAVTPLPRGIAA